MAQQGVERVGIKKHDYARTGRMTFYGGGTFPIAYSPFPPLFGPRPFHDNIFISPLPPLYFSLSLSLFLLQFSLPFLFSSLYSPTLNLFFSASDIRPRCDDLVSTSIHACQARLHRYNSRRARDRRPDSVCPHPPLHFLEHHVDSRGEGPGEENRQ